MEDQELNLYCQEVTSEDNIFITEDLTRYRQSIVGALADAKRAGYIDTYWTNDGRKVRG